MMKRFGVVQGLIFCFLALVCTATVDASGRVSVFVSIAPQKYFVEKIGGRLVEISVMVGAGDEPHTYEPKPQQMVALSKAKVYYAIGISFEKAWLKKIAASNPEMLVVHTEEGIEKIPMKVHHQRGEGEYRHGIGDPHIWLSPPLVMLQARNILQALLTVDPAHASIYQANCKKFIMEIAELDAEIRSIFTGKGRNVEFMVFHPAWGYFAQAYGLKQVPVEIEGKEPKPAELKRLIRHARERGVKVVFVQPQFSTKSAEVIANAIGGQIAFVDPIALDWASNLREVAKKFRAALK